MRTKTLLPLAIIGMSLVLSLYFYPQLPPVVASHWDAQGNANGYLSRFWGAFLAPLILVGIYLLFLAIPHIDPKKANIIKFRRQFDQFIVALLVFLLLLQIYTLGWNLGHKLDIRKIISPALAILFWWMAKLLRVAERNWFIGIRTPWTLESDIVWQKTHTLGAKLFRASAVLALGGVVLPHYALFLALAPILTVSVFLVVYSYFLYEKIGKNSKTS